MKNYHIYTDGSCKGNGTNDNVGAYGFFSLTNNSPSSSLQYDHMEAVACRDTTNNRMELQAVIAALEYVKNNGISITLGDNPEFIYIYTDSAYVYNCWAQKWYKRWQKNKWKTSRGTLVENQDLWKILIPDFENPCVQLRKVEGHSDDIYNNHIDRLVQNTAEKARSEIQC